MKIRLLTLIVAMISCQSNTSETSSKDTADANNIQTEEYVSDSLDTASLDSIVIFQYQSTEESINQRLEVTWIKDDSIEFKILAQAGACESHFRGTAKNNYVNMDPEVDEDENGDSYFASEYMVDEGVYVIKLRISVDRDRAKIIFIYNGKVEAVCPPLPDVVLKKLGR